MSKRTDVDQLVQLPDDEREERIQAAYQRIETRAKRADSEDHALSEREASLCADDKAELEALLQAVTIAEFAERTRQAVAAATDSMPRPETRAAFSEFVEALTRGVPHRVQETRCVTTAVAGARGAVAVE